jgi:hypothetical protein
VLQLLSNINFLHTSILTINFRGQAARAWRGRGRGRARGRGGPSLGRDDHPSSSATAIPRDNPQERTEPLGTVIDSFDATTLLVDDNDPNIENPKYVASYNWLNETNPHILVPGMNHRSFNSKILLTPWQGHLQDGNLLLSTQS